MKKYLLCLLACFTLGTAMAQDKFEKFKEYSAEKGLKFVRSKKIYLSQGKTDYAVWTLKPGVAYKIFCMSDDPSVLSTNLFVYSHHYTQESKLLYQDTETAKMAIVNIPAASEERALKFEGKNVNSQTPYDKSTFALMLFER